MALASTAPDLSDLHGLTLPELEERVRELDAEHTRLWALAKKTHADIDTTLARLNATEKLLQRRRKSAGQAVLALEDP